MQGLADAQRTFDQAAMDRLLTDDYVEVSPVGEVDSRAKVLSFYTPEARAKGPQPSSVVLDEPNIRTYGDSAVVIAPDHQYRGRRRLARRNHTRHRTAEEAASRLEDRVRAVHANPARAKMMGPALI